MADLNLNNVANKISGGIETFVNDKIGGVTGAIESVLGTGFTPNLSDQNFGKNRKQLKFPIDNQDQYHAYLRFKVKKIEPEQISTKALVAAQKAVASSDNKATSTSAQSGDNRGEFPTRAAADSKARVSAGAKKSGKIINPKRLINGSFVDLYMPVALSFSDALEYEGVDLGRIGGALESAVANGGSMTQGIMDAGKAGLSSFTEAFKGNVDANIARLAAVGIASKVSDTAAGAIKSATRVTTNPNTRTIFKGVGIRTFSFNFTMCPTSEKEAQQIKDIVYFFRSEIYPEVIREAASGIPLGYVFPNIFEIAAKYKTQDIAYKYLDCYLTGMQTTFNNSNMTMMRDGNFAETSISLSFTETRALDKSDIWKGY